MAKSVRNVMAGISRDKQIAGMTLEEIRTEFMMAGYGITKAIKRTNELLVSAQIQSKGDKRDGRNVFFCIYWPSATKIIDLSRVGMIAYEDARHTVLYRFDGKVNAWDLSEGVAE